MQPEDVKNAAQARKIVEERGLDHVKVGVFDADGIMRGKFMSRTKFFSALESGFGFCDVIFGWDSNDQQYDNVSFTGWHTAYPDALTRIVPESCRAVPHEFDGKGLMFIAEMAGEAEKICPRGILRRVLRKAEGMGFEALGAVEYEFFLFDETPDSIREKGYRNLKPITPGFFGYSNLRGSVWSELYEDILETAKEMRFPIEGLHTETGPGVLEAALDVASGLEAGDRAALFKTFIKVLAQRKGLMATFMAKWSKDYAGQSGHTHTSLKSKSGKPVFHDPKDKLGMSKIMRHYVAGQQKLLPELLAMIAPTVNSYTRLIPGFWAPTHATWGYENRTAALRVIGGSPKAQRVEFRIAAADSNPYLVLAAAIGSGLYGIEHKLDLPAPVEGNAYTQDHPKARQLPATLWDAAQALKASKAARELFGAEFVAHFAASREWEERENRKHISDWQLARYFEII